jgi:LytS/YehU family sensor histidine kinase
LLSVFTDCLFFLLCIYTGRWLCQRWYLRHKFLLFVLCSISAVISLSVFKWLLVRYAFNHPYAGFFEVFRDVMPFFLSGVILGMLLKLIRASMQKELHDAQIKAEQKQSEFNLLQSQLSPHFLFNVLNNLYGISIAEHERIPQLLLKLSNLLRYSVYGAKKAFVPLKDELEYIKNYIEFEQIRISDRLNLVMNIAQVSSPDIKIAPQVLIVFVENAFKHSKNTFNQGIDIDISLKITDNFICFMVSNSYHVEKGAGDILNESSGLGLANTIKRLNLLYGNDYELKQDAENDLYHVNLRLKIKE